MEAMDAKQISKLFGMDLVDVPNGKLGVGDLFKCIPDVHAAVKRRSKAVDVYGAARLSLYSTRG